MLRFADNGGFVKKRYVAPGCRPLLTGGVVLRRNKAGRSAGRFESVKY